MDIQKHKHICYYNLLKLKIQKEQQISEVQKKSTITLLKMIEMWHSKMECLIIAQYLGLFPIQRSKFFKFYNASII